MGLVPDTWFQMSHPRAHFYNSPGSFVPQHHGILDNKIPDPTVLPVVNVGATDTNGMHAQEHLCQKGREGSCRKTDLLRHWESSTWAQSKHQASIDTSKFTGIQSTHQNFVCTLLEEWHRHEPPAETQNYAMIHKARRLKIGQDKS